MENKLKICIAGATGFIGKNLLKKLEEFSHFEIIALSRKINTTIDGARKKNITWRRCNGFSLIDIEEVTKDCDILVYLIHSMLPTSTLAQGSFSEFDLYLADNFARAAHKNKIKKIIYLSGIIPENQKLSKHLQSRLEVENALAQYGNQLITLRASLIVGENGSSFKILERLIKRLPFLILPAWTKTLTQPIDLNDVLESLVYSIQNHHHMHPINDIGGPDIITYKEMLALTAKALNKKRTFISLNIFSPTLSRLWVKTVTGKPKSLVYPLVESLTHEMIMHDKYAFKIPEHKYTQFQASLQRSISRKDEGWLEAFSNSSLQINLKWLESVTSIQRIEAYTNAPAKTAVAEYFHWLHKRLRPFIFVRVHLDKVRFYLFGYIKLIELSKNHDRTLENRELFYISSGLLAKKNNSKARMEFRYIESSNQILIGLLDYQPSLPWFIYKFTQAKVHLVVMKAFERYMKKKYKNQKETHIFDDLHQNVAK